MVGKVLGQTRLYSIRPMDQRSGERRARLDESSGKAWAGRINRHTRYGEVWRDSGKADSGKADWRVLKRSGEVRA